MLEARYLLVLSEQASANPEVLSGQYSSHLLQHHSCCKNAAHEVVVCKTISKEIYRYL